MIRPIWYLWILGYTIEYKAILGKIHECMKTSLEAKSLNGRKLKSGFPPRDNLHPFRGHLWAGNGI